MTSVIVPALAKKMDNKTMMGYEGDELAQILIRFNAARRDFVEAYPELMDTLMNNTTASDELEVIEEAAHFYERHYL